MANKIQDVSLGPDQAVAWLTYSTPAGSGAFTRLAQPGVTAISQHTTITASLTTEYHGMNSYLGTSRLSAAAAARYTAIISGAV